MPVAERIARSRHRVQHQPLELRRHSRPAGLIPPLCHSAPALSSIAIPDCEAVLTRAILEQITDAVQQHRALRMLLAQKSRPRGIGHTCDVALEMGNRRHAFSRPQRGQLPEQLLTRRARHIVELRAAVSALRLAGLPVKDAADHRRSLALEQEAQSVIRSALILTRQVRGQDGIRSSARFAWWDGRQIHHQLYGGPRPTRAAARPPRKRAAATAPDRLTSVEPAMAVCRAFVSKRLPSANQSAEPGA